jgi:hypothetical protein
MSYVEKLAEREAILARVPQRRYISNEEYRKQKTALTRAINSGDPRKVLATCEKTAAEWSDTVWPDDWTRWPNALHDAASRARHQQDDYELANELYAAATILFNY